MIKRDQIPDEARFAAITTFGETIDMNKAIAAAINAWPSCHVIVDYENADLWAVNKSVVLPLPQEKNDD